MRRSAPPADLVDNQASISTLLSAGAISFRFPSRNSIYDSPRTAFTSHLPSESTLTTSPIVPTGCPERLSVTSTISPTTNSPGSRPARMNDRSISSASLTTSNSLGFPDHVCISLKDRNLTSMLSPTISLTVPISSLVRLLDRVLFPYSPEYKFVPYLPYLNDLKS